MARCLELNTFRGKAAFGRCIDEGKIAGGIKRIKCTNISRTWPSLIPGLPEDLARACLVRVSWNCRSRLEFVCKTWASYFKSHFYVAIRSQLRLSETLVVVLTQSRSFGRPRVSVFDPEALTKLKSQRPLAVFNFPRERTNFWRAFKCAVVGSDVFFIGGTHFGGGARCCCSGRKNCLAGWRTRNSVWRFNFVSRKWTAAAPMLSARYRFACAVIDGKIYVAGGTAIDWRRECHLVSNFSGVSLKSAEVYDYEHDQWHELPHMRKPRAECLGVAIEGRFYVISEVAKTGRFRLSGWCSRSVEVFDTNMCEWTTIKGMWQRNERLRFPPPVVGFDRALYAVDDKARMLRSYDDKLNRWNDVMPIPCLMPINWSLGIEGINQLIGLSSHGLYWIGHGGRLYNARQLDRGRWVPFGNVNLVDYPDEGPFLNVNLVDYPDDRPFLNVNLVDYPDERPFLPFSSWTDETYAKYVRNGSCSEIVGSGIVCI